jgi:uncharacterized Zn finger protein (UPF0148 family)
MKRTEGNEEKKALTNATGNDILDSGRFGMEVVEKKKRGRPRKVVPVVETIVEESVNDVMEKVMANVDADNITFDVCSNCGSMLIKEDNEMVCPNCVELPISKTCSECGGFLMEVDGETICGSCGKVFSDTPNVNACSDCGGVIFTEEDESMCSCCGKVFFVKEAKEEVVVNEVFTDELANIIKSEHQLFSNLASKYANSFTGDKEDLYNDLVIKTYEIYNAKASQFCGYNADFRNFLIRSLKNYCLNSISYANRHGNKEANEIPENYHKASTTIEYNDLTARERYLIEVFDVLDTEKYNIKKWDDKRLLNTVCVDIAEKENTDPHYILREFKVLASKL